MHSDWETFIAAYTNAPLDVQKLIDSDAIPNFIENLIEQYRIEGSKKRILVSQLSDVVLSLITVEDFIERIEKESSISLEIRSELQNAIKIFLSNPYEYKNSNASQTVSPQHIELGELPKAKEAVQLSSQDVETIPPLRTMQRDAERIHGYGAYRSRMKEKYGTPAPKPADNKNLADLPQYEDE